MENSHSHDQTSNLWDSPANQPSRSDAARTETAFAREESYFDGRTIQLIGWRLLGLLLTAITLGIGAPWAQCMILRWEARHTVINGKRLCFTGSGLQLLGKYLLWGLLIIITLGIYVIFIPVRMQKWRVSHTCFDTGKAPPKQRASAGLIFGVICGVALFLAIAVAAALFFLPKQDFGLFPSRAESTVPQPNEDAYIQTTLPNKTEGNDLDILYVVANGGLNLRTGPGKEYDVISNLPDGSMIIVQDRQNGWVFNGEGWCSGDYLSPDAPTSNIPGVASLYGNWMVVSDVSRSEYGHWCRGGSITLYADGTFSHSMRDYCRQSAEFGWYCPGGETSGGDCPYWKGTYQFTGSHVILNYQYEEANDYTYAEDGSPIYQGSHWTPVYRTFSLRVSLNDAGDLLLGYAAEIPIHTENTTGSVNTHQTLYRLPDYEDTFQSIYDALNRVLPY